MSATHGEEGDRGGGVELTLGEIAERLGARLVGDPALRIRGAAGIREAREGQITFLANPKYAQHLEGSRASAVILHESVARPAGAVLYADNPYLAFLQVLEIFAPGPEETEAPGVHPTAIVAPDAKLAEDVAIGPFVVVSSGSEIGPRTVVMAGGYIGPQVRVGSDCFLHPRVVLRMRTEIGDRVIIHAGAVLGDDGFGFAPDGDRYRKIPQLGIVVIEDDCDIGANTTIDRATTGETRIRRGTKIDNLVMIAHNVDVGEDGILCGQVGISGSTRLGRHVTLAGQVGLVGHIVIGDGVRVGAQGGVTKSLPANESYSGYPAQPHVRASRAYAALRSLPESLRQLRKMEERLCELERRLGAGEHERSQESPSGGARTPAGRSGVRSSKRRVRAPEEADTE